MILELLSELEVFLQQALATVPLPSPESVAGELAPARIFLGAIPRTTEDRKAFPCAVLRWQKGEDAEDGSTETVDILLGVFCPEGLESAETWIAVLVGRLRRLLLEQRRLSKWEMVLPLASAKPDPERQQERYHLATISTQWRRTLPSDPVMEA
ncbi:hypothetical protein N1030_01445 [Desulfovibrio mangrovi]|uniref:hypothetical protein n=1 Tax=Desulfovibrio mangrovi TaxID=2976983 RepID=UPI002246C497|nr:hypothetical protein [Desulfovibrio mangrovi]UZP67658.1 hypothetical protein N1030_01445 [Desulfovibrio mangrovi]